MEFRHLNTFMTIARLQSFSKAAEELGYAQSSISSQIQLLEQELKVRLFERLGHNITLTAEGSKLLPIAELILKLSMEAKSIAVDQEKPSGSLIIGAIETLCVSRLPNLLKEYRTRYSDVEILLKFGSTPDFLRSMKENTIDIAFFIDREIINDDYITVWQMEESMALICAPEYAFADREEVFPEDLSGEPLILTEPSCGYRALFDSIMSQFHIKPRSVIETGNVHAIKQLTLSGMGIAFLPVTAVEEELGQKRLIKLNWKDQTFPVFTQVLYHKSNGCPLRLRLLSI
jgi:DNA-binding transcriptional LysR family regulator